MQQVAGPAVDWDGDSIFIDYLGLIEYSRARNVPSFVDDGAEGKVPLNYFKGLFSDIGLFTASKYSYQTIVIPTNLGDTAALIRVWESDSAKIKLFVSNSEEHHGYAVVYTNANTFLVWGNDASHPFVITPDFMFFNSDGSTEEAFDFPSMTIDQIKNELTKRASDYVFTPEN